LAGNGVPATVDDAEHAVAVLHGVDNDADADDVVDLVERATLAVHLAVDRVDVLLAGAHLGADAGGGDEIVQLTHDRPEDLFGIGAAALQLAGDALVLFGFEIAKGQILELGLDLPDAQPVRQRGVDFHGLLGDA